MLSARESTRLLLQLYVTLSYHYSDDRYYIYKVLTVSTKHPSLQISIGRKKEAEGERETEREKESERKRNRQRRESEKRERERKKKRERK